MVAGGLIPGENVEEINLNYKDEASLESVSGEAAEVRVGGGGVRWGGWCGGRGHDFSSP